MKFNQGITCWKEWLMDGVWMYVAETLTDNYIKVRTSVGVTEEQMRVAGWSEDNVYRELEEIIRLGINESSHIIHPNMYEE